MTIPRILHQIWLGPANLLDHYRRWRQRFVRQNPGWDCRLWTDANLPPVLNRNAWDVAGSLPGTVGHVLRCDILRLEVLARFGGVYLDLDFRPVRPLDEFCDVSAWVAREHDEIITNCAMGFPPNHPAVWRAVDAIDESFFKHRRIVDQAGPTLVWRIFTQYPDVVLYPPHYFQPLVDQVRRTPQARLVLKAGHTFDGTWRADRMRRHRQLWEQTGVNPDEVDPLGSEGSES